MAGWYSKWRACKADRSAPILRAAWSTPDGTSTSSAPWGSLLKISSWSSPPPRWKSRKEQKSEKYSAHLQKRTQKLFRLSDRLSVDGVLRAAYRSGFLQRDEGDGQLRLP